MRFAFSRPTGGDDEQRVLFQNFHPIGYDGLQLKRGQYAKYLDDPQRFADDWGKAPGLAAGLITGGRLDEDGIASLRKVLRFASAMGSDRVIFCHGRPREGLTADDIRGFAKRLSELGAEARSLGTKLSLHHHFNQPVMHRADFDAFFDAVEDGAVGLTVDTAHLVKSGVDDIAGVVRDFAGAIDNFHLKDFADGRWRVLGEGEIDFAPVFTAIRDIGYDGWVSIDEESGGDIVGTMKTCYQFMTKALT